MKIMLIYVCLLLFLVPSLYSANIRVCYYGDWAKWRPVPARLSVTHINAQLCTHLVVSFVKVDEAHKLAYYNDDQATIIENAVKLRANNPGLKVLIAVGGWNHGSLPFSNMANAIGGPEKFAQSSIALLNKHNLDGLDIDWEYPQGVKHLFSRLLKTLKRKFDAFNKKYPSRQLLLTAAVTGNKHLSPFMYEFDVLDSCLDYVFVMSYDFHGRWDSKTGHQSALHEDKDNFDVGSAALFYARAGISKSKIIMGFPMYGRSFLLQEKDNHGVGAPTLSGQGVPGVFTNENGFLAYYEICATYLARGAKYVWDPKALASYLYQDRTWVSFDSKQALCHKLRWLHNHGFNGAMVWAIDLDDHANICFEGQYPLMTFLKKNVDKNLSLYDCDHPSLRPSPVPNPDIPTAKPVVPPPVPVPTGPTTRRTFCSDKEDGLYADPNTCRSFIQCLREVTYTKSCSSGLAFNKNAKVCDWLRNVDCNSTPSKATSVTKRSKPTLSSETTSKLTADFCSNKVDGYYQNTKDACHSFYRCFNRRTFFFECSGGLLFHAVLRICHLPTLVPCPVQTFAVI